MVYTLPFHSPPFSNKQNQCQPPRYEHWAFLIVPLFLGAACVWCSFALMNTVNLAHLMTKLSDHHGCAAASADLAGGAESESNSRAGGSIKKSASGSHNPSHNFLASGADTNSSNLRNSMLSQSSNLNGGRHASPCCRDV